MAEVWMDDFATFFEEYYGSVERTVAMAIGDRARAEDLTQEAFVRSFRRWRVVSAMERPVTWVYVVALNAERKRWRRDAHTFGYDDRHDAIAPDPAAEVVTTIVVRDALARLAPRQRATVALRYLADLPIAEIAVVMGCAEGTVKAALHQALRNLRIDLEGSEP